MNDFPSNKIVKTSNEIQERKKKGNNNILFKESIYKGKMLYHNH